MRWSSALPLLVLFSCTSARERMERASLYEQEGMMKEAHAAYGELYDRKPRAVEAHVGMKRTGQGLLDRKITEAMERYAAIDVDRGDQLRHEAVLLKQDMDRKGLELQWDGHLDEQRKTARAAHARDLVAQADSAFRKDRFAEAEDLALAAQRMDPELPEAAYLLLLAQLEPRYREAQRAEELGLWRAAHGSYQWITKRDAGYKDAWQRLEAAREKAAYTLAYVPLLNNQLYTAQLDMGQGMVEQQLSANVKQAILDLHDPLIVLVDRDNNGELLAEQQRNMEGTYDDRYVAQAGKLIGARYVLTARVLRFDDLLAKQMEVQMQLLNTESGRILLAEVIRVNKQELTRGTPRAQLMERTAKRMALVLSEFDPTAY